MLSITEMELPFAVYQERQLREISPAGLAARAAKLAPAEQFRFRRGQWSPAPYPGHAVVSMVAGPDENRALSEPLREFQRVLLAGLPEPGLLYPLPEESFHQTIANTLSGDNHQRLIVDTGLAADYPRIVTDTFTDFPVAAESAPLAMRMVGISIFGTAVGLLGIFNSEKEFQRVLHFRDHFYGHPRIDALGIRRTRPFIGHITLAYVERELDDAARARFVEVIASINRTIALQVLQFHLNFAELRAYDHLAEFKPLPGLPRYRL